MQRNLVAGAFVLATVMFGLAVGSWWLQFSVFTPRAQVGLSAALLSDEDVRSAVTTVVTASTADRLGRTPAEMASFVDAVLSSRAGAAEVTELMRDAHRRVLGQIPGPVRIDGEQMVRIVRDELVVDAPAVTLPVPEIGIYGLVGDMLGWIALVTAIIGLLATLFGFFARPDARDLRIGVVSAGLSLAGGLLLMAVVVPIWLLPSSEEGPWAQVVVSLARRVTPVTVLVAVLGVGAAVGVLALGRTGGRRNQWNAPIPQRGYSVERGWYR